MVSFRAQNSISRSLGVGVASPSAGTLAMDALLFRRAQRDGSQVGFLAWETAADIASWDDAAAPGQVGKYVAEGVLSRPVPDRFARPVNNTVHWVTGLAWGAQYGAAIVFAKRPRVWWGVLLGSTAMATSYVVLPAIGVYKPIAQYDSKTLFKDFRAHIMFGVVTSAVAKLLKWKLGTNRRR